ncbi:SDR family NAD(P)-dependent oxidoreductase [Ornithinibacter aureus]|uniref:SDR family NAD(P)-dependent oxidoreductase n=1 Tax=Ornithinibacter aureus TaxID=622664 RepID=UPI001FEC893A|nr:SDR family NAD(P)-dependent oxidoreductase [Ornithinibacter aureus]
MAAHGRVDGLLNVAGIIQPFVRRPGVRPDREGHGRELLGCGPHDQGVPAAPESRPQAAVVNVSSMGALAPVPGQSVYGASKAAVMLLTEALYTELKGSPVAVSVVFSGGVATHIAENSGAAIPG